uniref:Uncharacterized protein n=1 Tax=Arundo donax TaxID=35708 RepID=A0A0A9F602_ARUDO
MRQNYASSLLRTSYWLASYSCLLGGTRHECFYIKRTH